jgi:hypothetical protein
MVTLARCADGGRSHVSYSRTSDPNRRRWYGLVAVIIGAVLTLGVFTYSSKP